MTALAALALTAALTTASTTAASRACSSCARARCSTPPKSERSASSAASSAACPWVAWLALLGTLAIAGVPPLNGFVSEWLLLQAFLAHARPAAGLPQHADPASRPRPRRPDRRPCRLRDGEVLRRGLPRPAAREEKLAPPHDCGRWERVALLWLAAWLRGAGGVLPVQVIDSSTRSPCCLNGRGRGCDHRRKLALPRAHQSRPGELQPLSSWSASRLRDLVVWSRAQVLPRPRAAGPPGTAASRCRRRACRTPPRASVSRCASSSAPFFRIDARAAVPLRRRAAIAWSSRIPLALDLRSDGRHWSTRSRAS